MFFINQSIFYLYSFHSVRIMKKIFISDFDGTITQRDVIESIMDKFALPYWKKIHDDLINGIIDKNLKHNKKWDEISGYKTKSILSIPIEKGNKKLGILELINKEPYFTKEDEEKIKLIVKFIGIALDNAINIVKMIQKQEEEKTIIENIAEAIVITDTEMKIIEVNSSFMEMIGFRYSFEQIKNEYIYKILNEIAQEIKEKTNKLKENWISSEITYELLRIKILPVITKEFNEEKLKKIVYIFKYPKG